MSDMIERVARAIHGQSFVTMPWDHLNNPERDSYVACAKAAIEAMREPTDAMVAAPTQDEIEAIWKAMIDEALK